uniref:Putative ribonuclease H-like domain-containing protein n=1 Tax=Tanacetum cinerariifolium TaxID=118510 RepID=A0A6L2KNL1_TANCI|nr:putative ribonuclease H-like domain-containing protein [Tanacetum cinerariifolium]
MGPFGFPVTILNTLDPLDKFDEKADEGFFIGYSVNSKVTDIQYMDNIEAKRTKSSMRMERAGRGKKDAKDPGNEDYKVLSTKEPRVNQEKDANVNNTNNINTVSPTANTASIKDNAVDENIIYGCVDDPNMRNLEEIVYSDEDEDVGTEANMKIFDTNIHVSPILTTIIHKDHPVEQIIRDIHSASQTRRMTKNVTNYGMFSSVQQRINHKDFHNCLFACFLSQVEPKKRASGTKWIYRNKKDERGIVVRNKARLVVQGYTQEKGIDYDEVFAPVSRIEAIRLFLAYASFKYFLVYQMVVKSAFLYGKIEKKAYVCQPPGFEDPEFPNKVYKVEKALYGLHQAPRAWYETLSTYLLNNRFHRGQIDKTLYIKRVKGDILLVQVYVDDIIFGSTKKEMCTEFEKMMHKKFQMSSMGELTFFLGLQVTQKMMEFSSASINVYVHLYRLMIGSLMYLTSSRPDIMFVVYACARFQVTPKVLHLYDVKRIFRYLKGQSKLGLWYPKDSPFELKAYTDSDYAGASLDRKSTTGENADFVEIVDFLNASPIRYALIARKRFSRRATPLFETMLIQHPGEVCEDETVHKKRGDRVERAAATASSLEAEQDSGTINRTQSTKIPNEPIPQGTGSGGRSMCQDTILGDPPAQTRFERLSKQSHEPPLSRDNTLGSREDSMQLMELMALCTTLSDRVLDKENVKDSQALEIQKLKKRVKWLEKKKKSRTSQLKKKLFKVRIESSAEKILETQGRYGHDIEVNTASTSITTASINLTAAEPVTTVNAPVTTAGVSVSTVEPSTPPTTATTLIEDEDLIIAYTLMKIRCTRKYWKIIRVGNHTEVHHFFDDMLKALDMDDLVMLWSLVKEKFNLTEPTDDKEREIWVELKRLFEPNTDDEKGYRHLHTGREGVSIVKRNSYIDRRIVGFKRLLSDVEVTDADMEVTIAGSGLDLEGFPKAYEEWLNEVDAAGSISVDLSLWLQLE